MTTPNSQRPPFPRRRDVQGRAGTQASHQRAQTPPATPQPNGLPLFETVTSETTGMRSRRLEVERRRARRRKRNRRIRAFVILAIVIALLGCAAVYAVRQLTAPSSSFSQLDDDYPGPGSGSVEVTIDVGETGAEIGQSLVDADVVKSVAAFIRSYEANKAATMIRPGTYTLKMQMSASDAVAALLDDANRSDNTVTVTPGQTKAEIAERISSVTDFSVDDVTAAFEDASAIGLPDVAGGNVEGWLAPGSYEVASSDTPMTLVAQMVANTISTLDSAGVAEDQREIVLNKASILEREVNLDEYLPKVARVIENRLATTENETRGLLQMDSTVLYGVGKTGGVPTASDLLDENPYNTYLHQGIPPSPIAQPSEAAIKAVMHPADGDWLYYVTIDLDTGETVFASTLADHEANQQKFKDYCKANPGKC